MKPELDQIKDLFDQFKKDFETIYSKQEITKDYGIATPQDNNFCIDLIGNVIKGGGCGLLSFHNAFPTEEAAAAEAKYTLISRQYRNFAKKLNGEKPFEWDNPSQDKWKIDHYQNVFKVDRCKHYNSGLLQVAFHERAHAELAFKVFGNDLLILANN